MECNNVYQIKNKKVFECLNNEVANIVGLLLNKDLDNRVIVIDKYIYTALQDFYLVNYNGINIIKNNNLTWGVSRVDINDEVKPLEFMSISRNFLPTSRTASTDWEYIRIPSLVPEDISDYTNGLSVLLKTNICYIYHTDNSLEFLADISIDDFSRVLMDIYEYNKDNNIFDKIMYYNELGTIDKEMTRYR